MTLICIIRPQYFKCCRLDRIQFWDEFIMGYGILETITTTWLPSRCYSFNSLRLRLNRRPFAVDTFKCIFLNENDRISIKISLKFGTGGPVDHIPTLVQIMAWCRPGDKPLSEPMMVRLPTHICVTQPQWFKISHSSNTIDDQLPVHFLYGYLLVL